MAIEEQRKIPLGVLEDIPHGSDVLATGLRENGTQVAFGVHGGDLWNLVDQMSWQGIKIYTMRHEASGVYAAEGYSKVTRKVGVFYADCGPGIVNAASAIQQAWISCSPIFGFCGAQGPGFERAYPLQPSYPSETLKKITKWTQYITTLPQLRRYVSKGFKDAQIYPKGPCVVEISGESYFTKRPEKLPVRLHQEKWRGEETGKPLPSPAGDPELVEQAVRMIAAAKRPVIMAGDGVHWSDAGSELVKFAELAQVPVSGRRIGRGAMPETHPLHFCSRIHRNVMPESDLLILIGMKVGGLDSDYGRGWPEVIQINESYDHVWEFLKSRLIVQAGSKVVLKQMIECMKANKVAVDSDRQQWVARVNQLNSASYERLQAKALKYKDRSSVVHHGWLCKALWDTCEEFYGGMNRVVTDGFTISGYFPAFPKARYSAQLTDASEQGGVGHGVGMAIGAAVGDPESYKRPVIALMGDSGMGEMGYDVETAARFNLPIVYIVTNNDGWLTGMMYQYYGVGWKNMGVQDHGIGQSNFPRLRYDKISQELGCHGEYVDNANDLRPALERSLRSAENGKPTVLNVIVEPTLMNPVCTSTLYSACFSHIPWDMLPKFGKRIRRNFEPWHPWDEYGIPPMPAPDPWDPVPEDELEP